MIQLWQFRYSPYNEKARWALALKGIAHETHTVLPGPHMRTMKKLSRQTKTPVLVIDGKVTPGSAAILSLLDERFPEPPLMPGEPPQREKVLEIQRWFDDDIGPRLRRTVLASMLGHPGYVAETFAGDKPWATRTFYRSVLPLAAGMIRKGNGIRSEADVEDGLVAAEEAFDFIERETSDADYLVGERFTIADLTAASILATVVNPDHPAMKRPEPIPEPTRALIARFANRPGADWVRRIYAMHRP